LALNLAEFKQGFDRRERRDAGHLFGILGKVVEQLGAALRYCA
jgi:hypothetical protein